MSLSEGTAVGVQVGEFRQEMQRMQDKLVRVEHNSAIQLARVQADNAILRAELGHLKRSGVELEANRRHLMAPDVEKTLAGHKASSTWTTKKLAIKVEQAHNLMGAKMIVFMQLGE